MDPLDAVLAGVGLLLVFVLPGFTVTKAVFPEWRVRGRSAGVVAVELAALSVVTSVSFTILFGYGLLSLPGAGFAAGWSNPLLEMILAGVAAIGLVVGIARGAYAPTPPAVSPPEPSPGSEDGWQLIEQLHAIDRERRRVRHALRAGTASKEESNRQRERLDQLDRESEMLRARREAEYGS